MPDAGEVKAIIRVEYDGSGVEQAKADIASLSEVGGGFEKATASIGENLSTLSEQAAQSAENAGVLAESVAGLEKPLETGQAALQQLNTAMQQTDKVGGAAGDTISTLSDQFAEWNQATSAIPDTLSAIQKPIDEVQKSIEHLAEPLGQMSNLGIFQGALADSPEPFQYLQGYLQDTQQSWQEFADSIGTANAEILTSNEAFQKDFLMSGAASTPLGAQIFPPDAAPAFVTTNERARDAAESLGVFATASTSAADSSKTLKETLASTWGLEGNDLTKAVAQMGGEEGSLGKIFSAAGADLGGAFMGISNFVMPLMAFQMVGMAVSAVATGIYNMAQLAEGPAAHSVGTFTGSVDALGQTLQKSGEQFSESFGQQMMPTLDAMNYQASQGGGGNFAANFLGGTVAFLSNIGQLVGGLVTLTMPFMGPSLGMPLVKSGWEGLVNQVASTFGLGEPYQGPPATQNAAQQYTVTQLSQMPQTVDMSAAQLDMQAFQALSESMSPAYLQSSLDNQAAQRILQQQQMNYLATHGPPSKQQLLDRQYYESQGFSPDEIAAIEKASQTGDWLSFPYGVDQVSPPSGGGGFDLGKFFGGIGGGIGGIFGNIGSFFRDNMFSGLSWNYLLSGDSTSAAPGCFPAGTRVRMADGTERAIETLEIGEQVSAHDGWKQVAATITKLHRPPRKMVYELIFDDGNALRLTDAHPVATTQGWKSLSPAASMREIPGIEVSRLTIGDVITTTTGTCTLSDWHPVEVMQVYNIAVDAPHTFYAENILVHNNPKFQSAANTGLGAQIADMVANIQLPKINLSSITSDLAGAFSSIQLPHLDLSGLTSGMSTAFAGIQLPHIDLSGITSGLASAFSSIQLPHIDFSAFGDIGNQISNMFSSIHLPSLPDIAGNINSAFGNLFGGIHLPSLPDIAGDVNSLFSNAFGSIHLPSIPDIAGQVNTALGNMFGGIHLPSLPDIAGSINSALSSMFSGISATLSMPGIPLYASGVRNAPPGLAVVGDAGPELLMMSGGESVFPMSSLDSGGSFSSLGDMFGGGSGQIVINLTSITTLDGRIVAQQTIPYVAPMARLASGSRRA